MVTTSHKTNLTFLRLDNLYKHFLTRPEVYETRAVSSEVVHDQTRIIPMDVKYSMVFHLQFIDLVEGAVLVDDYCGDIGITINIIYSEFSEAITINGFIGFVDGHWSVTEALISVCVVHSSCCPCLETCQEDEHGFKRANGSQKAVWSSR